MVWTIRAVAALLMLACLSLGRNESAEATGWAPGYSFCLDDAATGLFSIPMPPNQPCDGNPAAGQPTDARTARGITEPAYNFDFVTSFAPAASADLSDQNIPLGAIVGRHASKRQLSSLGNPCSNSITVFFTLFFSSLDMNDTLVPKPPGQTNQLEFFASDDDNDGLPNAVEKYPEYLKKFFDPDYSKGPDGVYDNIYGGGDDVPGPNPPLQPIGRATGLAVLVGFELQLVLNVLVFPVGTNLANVGYPDLPTFDSTLGYPSVTILQDPTALPSPSVFSNFCSPQDVVALDFGLTRDNPCTPLPGASGCPDNPVFPAPYTFTPDPEGCDAPARAQPDPDNNEASCATRKNPPDGTYTSTMFARSLRDADDDSIENNLDTCALVPSPGYNPRAPDSLRDPDGDGLPSPPEGCDPAPTVRGPQSPPNCTQGNVGPDTDGDCYSDRQDNCAAVLFGDGTIDINKSYNKGQEDQDSDGIGDLCDPEPNVPNGHRHEVCIPVDITIPSSPNGAPGSIHEPPCEVVDPGDDSDSDGFPDPTEIACGSDRLSNASIPERVDGIFIGNDDNGDTAVEEPLPPSSGPYDCDADGWTGSQEKLIFAAPTTTKDQDPCGNNGWPGELTGDDNILNVADIASFLFPERTVDDGHGMFNKYHHPLDDAAPSGIDAAMARWNLLASPHLPTTMINIGDLNALNPAVNAPTARPPMFGGQPAFFTDVGNGVGACPFPP